MRDSEEIERCHNCGVSRQHADEWIPRDDNSRKDGYCSEHCMAMKLGLF